MNDLIVDCFAGGGGASVGIEMALDAQPTAYEVDKMVERLEKSAMKMSTAKLPHTDMKAIGTHKVIEIVKEGEVNEQ